MNKQYYVYILSNHRNTVLYTGITNDLCKRVWGHKQELVSGFTKKYHVHTLLYYELYADPSSAIEREKEKYPHSQNEPPSCGFIPRILYMNPTAEDPSASVGMTVSAVSHHIFRTNILL